MKWKHKPKTKKPFVAEWKREFAFFPVLTMENEWVWLEMVSVYKREEKLFGTGFVTGYEEFYSSKLNPPIPPVKVRPEPPKPTKGN